MQIIQHTLGNNIYPLGVISSLSTTHRLGLRQESDFLHSQSRFISPTQTKSPLLNSSEFLLYRQEEPSIKPFIDYDSWDNQDIDFNPSDSIDSQENKNSNNQKILKQSTLEIFPTIIDQNNTINDTSPQINTKIDSIDLEETNNFNNQELVKTSIPDILPTIIENKTINNTSPEVNIKTKYKAKQKKKPQQTQKSKSITKKSVKSSAAKNVVQTSDENNINIHPKLIASEQPPSAKLNSELPRLQQDLALDNTTNEDDYVSSILPSTKASTLPNIEEEPSFFRKLAEVEQQVFSDLPSDLTSLEPSISDKSLPLQQKKKLDVNKSELAHNSPIELTFPPNVEEKFTSSSKFTENEQQVINQSSQLVDTSDIRLSPTPLQQNIETYQVPPKVQNQSNDSLTNLISKKELSSTSNSLSPTKESPNTNNNFEVITAIEPNFILESTTSDLDTGNTVPSNSLENAPLPSALTSVSVENTVEGNSYAPLKPIAVNIPESSATKSSIPIQQEEIDSIIPSESLISAPLKLTPSSDYIEDKLSFIGNSNNNEQLGTSESQSDVSVNVSDVSANLISRHSDNNLEKIISKSTESEPILVAPEIVEVPKVSATLPEIVQAPAVRDVSPEIVEVPKVSATLPEIVQASAVRDVSPEIVEAPKVSATSPEIVQAPAIRDVSPEIVQASAVRDVSPEIVEAPKVSATSPEIVQAPAIRDVSPEIVQASAVRDVSPEIVEAPKVSATSPEIVQAPAIRDVSPEIVQASAVRDVSPEIVEAPKVSATSPEIVQAPAIRDVSPEIVQASALSDVSPEIVEAPKVSATSPEIVQAPAIRDVSPEIVQASALSDVSPEIVEAPAVRDVSAEIVQAPTISAALPEIVQAPTISAALPEIVQAPTISAALPEIVQAPTISAALPEIVQAPTISAALPEIVQAPTISAALPEIVEAPAVSAALPEIVQAPAVRDVSAEIVQAPAVRDVSAEIVQAPAVRDVSAEIVQAPAVRDVSAEIVQAPTISAALPEIVQAPTISAALPEIVQASAVRDVSSDVVEKSTILPKIVENEQTIESKLLGAIANPKISTFIDTSDNQDIAEKPTLLQNQVSTPPQAEQNTTIKNFAAPKGYATGGQVTDSQIQNPQYIAPSDTVPAMLTPGEFVINTRDAQKNLGLLQHINTGGTPQDIILPNLEIPNPKEPEQTTSPQTSTKVDSFSDTSLQLKSFDNQSPQKSNSLVPSSLGLNVEKQKLSILNSPQLSSVENKMTDGGEPSPQYSSPPMIFRKANSTNFRTKTPSKWSDTPSEWSSVEELLNGNDDKFTSFFTGAESKNQNSEFSPVSKSEYSQVFPKHLPAPRGFADGGEVTVSDAYENRESLTETVGNSFSQDEEHNKDNTSELETLAREIYSRLRQRLEIERERHGGYSGRLSW
ncbi:hypothetical protein [Nostoc sp. C117]|uniref:hypothetical protein n=1 Tax=Nostoc sp. C117 TaxID=3349875 RepID=UPI00370D35AA